MKNRNFCNYKLYINIIFIILFSIFLNKNIYADIENKKEISVFCQEIINLNSSSSHQKALKKICDNYQELDYLTKKIIDDYKLPQTYALHSNNLNIIEKKLANIDKLVNFIKPEVSSDLNQKLNFITQTSRNKFKKSQNVFFMAQQDVYHSGSFLIGTQGYIKVLGEDIYLNNNNLPVKFTVVKGNYVSGDTSKKDLELKECPNNQIVSFKVYNEVGDSDLQDKFLAKYNDKFVLESNRVLINDKQAQSAFCLKRSGNGVILKLFGDIFLNSRANNYTNNIKNAGVFTFVSEIELKQSQIVEDEFNLNKYGYLVISNPVTGGSNLFKVENEDKNSITNPYLQIISPLYISNILDNCYKNYSFSLSIVNDDNNELYISSSGQKIQILTKNNLKTENDYKNATFCLIKTGSSYYIKNLYNQYIDNQINKKNNHTVSDPLYAGKFNLMARFKLPPHDKDGLTPKKDKLGSFVNNKVGYIGTENNKLYISSKSFLEEKTQYKSNNPIRFIIRPVELSQNIVSCTDNDLAVRFEFLDQENTFLSRDEWQLRQVDGYAKYSSDEAVFCIEEFNGSYFIKDLNGYYLSTMSDSFTKNPDDYGKFLFYDMVLTDINSESVVYYDNQSFQNNSVGYIKSKNNDLILSAKDIDTYIYHNDKLTIKMQDLIDDTYCSVLRSIPVAIFNQSSKQLVNYYGNLYFVNKTLNLAEGSKVFCLLRTESTSGHYIYSSYGAKIAYLSTNAMEMTYDFENAGIFEFTPELKYLAGNSLNNQADVASFRNHNYGYIKYADSNKYLSLSLFNEAYNNRAGFPVKFKVIAPVEQNTPWCNIGMLVSFESAYNPGKFLFSNIFDNNLTLIDAAAINDDKQKRDTAFCLEYHTNGFALKTPSGMYISRRDSSKVTRENNDIGLFKLVDHYLDTGLSDTRFIRQFEHSIIYKPGAENYYLTISTEGKLLFTDDFSESKSFQIVPALINKYKFDSDFTQKFGIINDGCISIKSTRQNSYVSYDSNQIILKNILDSHDYAANASFCPVNNFKNHTTLYYLFNNKNYFLANQSNVLTLLFSDEIPINDAKFQLASANPRDIVEKLPALETTFEKNYCHNLQPRGKIISSNTRVISRSCGLLTDLKNILNEVDLDYNFTGVDITGQCCSFVVDYIPTQAVSISDEECQVSYDIICNHLDISNPGFL